MPFVRGSVGTIIAKKEFFMVDDYPPTACLRVWSERTWLLSDWYNAVVSFSFLLLRKETFVWAWTMIPHTQTNKHETGAQGVGITGVEI